MVFLLLPLTHQRYWACVPMCQQVNEVSTSRIEILEREVENLAHNIKGAPRKPKDPTGGRQVCDTVTTHTHVSAGCGSHLAMATVTVPVGKAFSCTSWQPNCAAAVSIGCAQGHLAQQDAGSPPPPELVPAARPCQPLTHP